MPHLCTTYGITEDRLPDMTWGGLRSYLNRLPELSRARR